MSLDALAAYVRDLLVYDASLIVIGRENLNRVTSGRGYILIDELVSTPMGRRYAYNGTTEVEQFVLDVKGAFTIDFFGDSAAANAKKFRLLQSSEKSFELQRTNGICVGHTTTITDLKSLDGNQFNPRFQIVVNVVSSEAATVSTLRIDTAVVQIINNE